MHKLPYNPSRHSGESRNPGFPVKTETQSLKSWMPDQVRHDGKKEQVESIE